MTPKMILFDFGGTLLQEDAPDGLSGITAVMKYAVENKSGASAKEIADFYDRLFETTGIARKAEMETHEHMHMRFLFDYFGITLSIPFSQAELIFWDNFAVGRPTPGIEALLKGLQELNIRTGVLSNISFSGETLRRKIQEHLPENHFEFIIATSEYIIRKPNPLIFQLALRKADLKPQEVWYCGDNLLYDVNGAASAGIFPVWYESGLPCYYGTPAKNPEIIAPHLHIQNWNTLLEKLKKA